MPFVRPANLKFPQIYGTFKAMDKANKSQVEYVIQDLPEANFEEALNLLVDVYLPDEALYSCRGLVGNADAAKEAKEFWRKKLEMKTSLACFQVGSTELAGLYVLGVVCDGDSTYEVSYFTESLLLHLHVIYCSPKMKHCEMYLLHITTFGVNVTSI